MVRDMQKLGHPGLGKKSYFKLGRVFRKEGVHFPTGGKKEHGTKNGQYLERVLWSYSVKIYPLATPYQNRNVTLHSQSLFEPCRVTPLSTPLGHLSATRRLKLLNGLSFLICE